MLNMQGISGPLMTNAVVTLVGISQELTFGIYLKPMKSLA
jgi:hypothetical protein